MNYDIEISSTEESVDSVSRTLVMLNSPTKKILHKFTHVITIKGLSSFHEDGNKKVVSESLAPLLKLVRAGPITFLYEEVDSPPDNLQKLKDKLIEILDIEDKICGESSPFSPTCYIDCLDEQ